MTNTIRSTLALLLSAATQLAVAHPGPHAHTSIDNAAPHAYLGWPVLLIVGVAASVVALWRWRARQQ